MSTDIKRFIPLAKNLRELEIKVQQATIQRDQQQRELSKVFQANVKKLLEQLKMKNMKELAVRLGRTPQALSNCVIDVATVPILLSVHDLLEGRKPNLPKMAKKPRKNPSRTVVVKGKKK